MSEFDDNMESQLVDNEPFSDNGSEYFPENEQTSSDSGK